MGKIKKTALVYCEAQFGLVDGKTAAGLVRHSEVYTIVGVIDSLLAGKDAGHELEGKRNGIPIFTDFKDALYNLSETPDCYIYGKAPLEASLSIKERFLIIEAMQNGMDIVNGLHQLFSEDKEFVDQATLHNIHIKDIRKPPELKELHVFTGQISKVDVPVIAVLGTDCACGKRTTAVELNKVLNDIGIKSVLVATGQSGLMQGARYGISIDALPSQFVIGEIENAVVQAFDNENPDIILVEGQSSVGHPAFMSSNGILKGSMPDGIILQHSPGRQFRCDFPNFTIPTVESEIKLIKNNYQVDVLAITLSHENLFEIELNKIIADYEENLHLPTTDVLLHGCDRIVQALREQFPQLDKKIITKNCADVARLNTAVAPSLSIVT